MKKTIMAYLKNDQIIIKIEENATQQEIMDCLGKKVSELKKFYKDEKTPIIISGKVLKNKEMDEIQELIKEKIDVQIQFETPKSLGLHSIKKTFDRDIAISETEFHRGSLRSGQKIESDGSLVIIGDVNSGAEIIASDNIIVLGNLRGLAHAGAKGNRQAIIAAGNIDTVQIRIANIVKEMNRDEEFMHRQACAYVVENEIIID